MKYVNTYTSSYDSFKTIKAEQISKSKKNIGFVAGTNRN